MPTTWNNSGGSSTAYSAYTVWNQPEYFLNPGGVYVNKIGMVLKWHSDYTPDRCRLELVHVPPFDELEVKFREPKFEETRMRFDFDIIRTLGQEGARWDYKRTGGFPGWDHIKDFPGNIDREITP